MHHHSDQERQLHRNHIHKFFQTVFNIEDSSAVELFATLHRVAHLSEMLGWQTTPAMDISGPRWGLMLRLFIEERNGNSTGLTPTVLSRSQRVSRNTISALLRGLEDQGLIQRRLDPDDLRLFHIQLTDAGRTLILTSAPERIHRLNQLLSGLSPEETSQLQTLLEKLYATLQAQAGSCPAETPPNR